PHVAFIAPNGIVAAFVDNVLRNDQQYLGGSMTTGQPLSFVHRSSDVEGTVDPAQLAQRLAHLSFQNAAPIRDEFANDDERRAVKTVAAPPLRYGDIYEIAAFVIDRVGGLPKALWRDDLPWHPEIRTLAGTLALDGKQQKFEFRRCVPVGEVNI